MITIDEALELYENDELDEARKAFQILAQEDDFEAHHRLGMMASYGEGQPEDPVLAAKHYRIAAEAGHTVAQYCLAVFCARGRGVEQDYQQALRWYQAAADAGDADALFNLGIMHARGQGTPVDVEKAVDFWKQAAALGQADAMFELGNAFRDRVAGQADMVEASEWYLRAWKKHHERAYDAVLAIVPQLERCAEEGYALACYNLGVIYKFALDDNAKAFRWFFQGAELEHPKCVKALGDCYRKEKGSRQIPQRPFPITRRRRTWAIP